LKGAEIGFQPLWQSICGLFQVLKKLRRWRQAVINKHIFKEVLSVVIICWMVSIPVCAADMDLVDLLSSQLGVTKDQAEGGAGSIFQLAKQNLSVKNFSTVAKGVPGIDQMIGRTPKAGTSSSTL
jgi:hypothetical protein